MEILTATRDYLKSIAMLKIDSIIDSALSTLISTIIEAGVLRRYPRNNGAIPQSMTLTADQGRDLLLLQ